MKPVLVVSYSRSGNTSRVAKAIAAACGADVEELKELRERKGLAGWLRSALEAWRRRLPAITPTQKDPRDYSLVVIGSPVWVHTVSAPMRRYIADHRNRFAKIATFVTEGGSGGAAAMKEMAKLCGKTPVATLELTAAQLKSGAYRKSVSDFAARLKPAEKPARARRKAPAAKPRAAKPRAART